MSTDPLDWIDQPETVETVAETPAVIGTAPETTVETPVEQPSTEPPVSTPTSEAPASIEEPTAEQARFVPIGALLDERDKRKAAEARLAERPAAEEPEVPDINADPQGYFNYVQEQNALTVINERLNTSERFARIAHPQGDLVDKVKEWATARIGTDQEFAGRILSDPDPYGAAIIEYQALQVQTTLGGATLSEAEEFKAWKAAKAAGGDAPANPGAAPANPVPAASAAPASSGPTAEPLPTSIADDASAGGSHNIPVGAGQAFDSLFPN